MTSSRPDKSRSFQRFKSHPLLPFGSLQTVAGRYWWQLPDVKYDSSHLVKLDDGDSLLVMEYTPKGWKTGDESVVLMHGLVGCYQSSYMIRMTRKLMAKGYKVFRVNLRGAGPGLAYAKKMYHSGRSEDARAVLNWVNKNHPESQVNLIGFSLSGNIVLKTAGEVDLKPKNLKRVIAVSPPADLNTTADRIIKKGKIFNYYFVNTLRSEVKKREKLHPELEVIDLPSGINMIDFDELYTARLGGFKSARDYYTKSSALPLLNKIEVPTFILHAMDDPIVDGNYLLNGSITNPKVETLVTEHGGHLGFIDRLNPFSNFRWMDKTLLYWLSKS